MLLLSHLPDGLPRIAQIQEVSRMNQVEALDSLIETCIDSEKRYRHAARDVGRSDLEAFFRQQAENRKAAAAELEAKRGPGGAKKESGTLAGLLDRTELDLSVVMSKGDSGVVEWCREDAKKVEAEFEKVLKSVDLPADSRPIVQRQLAAVRNTISELERVLRVYGGPRS
jgi:uncharacterized protein (TIGR02284 family)